jgi:TRAP-type C4-dicarboxylate transport system permease small subunit
MNNDEHDNLLDRVARVFLWCFLLTFALLLFWFGFYVLAGDWAYRLHAGWFELSRRDFALVNYWGMAFTKFCAIIMFLIPFISIKLVLRKKMKST